VPAFILYVDIPVAVLYEYRYIFMAQKPPYVIVIPLIFRRINRKGKIPTAQSHALITLTFFRHHNKLQKAPNLISYAVKNIHYKQSPTGRQEKPGRKPVLLTKYIFAETGCTAPEIGL
jgi:hypothetical protein